MLISYIAALFSIIGVWFNIQKKSYCWFLFMASDSLWFAYSLNTHQWAITIMHTLFICVNFYGLYKWNKKALINKETNNVKI